MAFDFRNFLLIVDPSSCYDVQRLTGGVINLTVRATRTGEDNEDSRFANHSSIILKQAPPYIAGVGEHALISQVRQVVEARALSLFAVGGGPLYWICERTSVILPKLLHHDINEHVIAISDLGALPNLSDVFNPLGGYSPGCVPDLTVLELGLKLPDARWFSNLGQRLGTFFSLLHSKRSFFRIVDDPLLGPDYLSNPTMPSSILELAIQPILPHLLSTALVSPSEASILYARIEANFLRPTLDDEMSLVLGDCWPGAILVDLESSDSKQPDIGVVDWEFASLGRGVHGDMSQLLAHLHLLQIAAWWKAEKTLLAALTELIKSIAKSYRTTTAEEGIFSTSDQQHAAPAAGSLSTRLMRSAFISYGAEMINCAFWKLWPCHDARCIGSTGPHPADAKDCKLIQRMVETAIWHLRKAGDDEADFVKPENWTNVMAKETVLRSLFS